MLQKFLGPAIFSNGVPASLLSWVVRVLRGSSVVTDLQTKAAKYEAKATQCEDWARQAADGPQRTFFEVLAGYYGKLATDFRQVIEKRTVA